MVTVLVQVEAVEFALFRHAKQSECIHRKHYDHRNGEGR